MNTRIHKSAAWLLGIGLLMFSQAGWSLGLGDARVQSFLDQPLRVEIELLTREGDDLANVVAGLASAADYELIGASRNDISVPLAFQVEGVPGQAYITVSSQLPVNNPVIRLIVEVNSATGRLLREYTLFLDPATISQPAPAPTPSTAPARQADTAATRPAAASQPSSTSPARVPTAGEYGPVQSGETLWGIAKNWSEGSGISINQAMVAIQRNNPSAFAGGNINRLQRGAILRLPDLNDVRAISRSEANQEVREQTAALQTRSDVTSADTPLLMDDNAAADSIQPAPEPEPEPELQPQPAIESELDFGLQQQEPEAAEEAEAELSGAPEEESIAAEPEAEQPLAETEPQLELVPPSVDTTMDSVTGLDESTDEGVATDVLREELARKEEELINQQQQNEYLEQRLQELESRLAAAEEGMVDDQDMAAMEERLQQERLAQQAEEESWFSGNLLWWLGLLIAIAALGGWFYSRRAIPYELDTSGETLRDIQDEAEEVLKVLDSDAEKVAPKAEDAGEGDETVVQEIKPAESPDADDADEDQEPEAEENGKKYDPAYDEAEVLDEESADPEIQLDLARAYISMGDKEAARVILEEVIANGTDSQQAEATKMKNLL